MPTRYLKPDRNIPTAIRRHLRDKPCVICGVPYGIQIDHIKPYVKGGESIFENLQPLCSACNKVKKHLRNNDETAEIIHGRGVGHFLEAFYKHHTRQYNPYDGPSLTRWMAENRTLVLEACELREKFSATFGEK